MPLPSIVWRLASPYDAYVSHVARLNEAVGRIRHAVERAQHYEAGLQASGRVTETDNRDGEDPQARLQRFRLRLGTAAANLSDEQFEAFIGDLGGPARANVERDRAETQSRMHRATRGLEDHFAEAGRQLAVLEARGYNPARPDVARQLRENHLPATTLADYRHVLHTLGLQAGQPQR